MDATAGNITITLPTLALDISLGREYKFVRVDASPNTITIQTTASDKLDGVPDDHVVSPKQFDHIDIVSCVDAWLIY